ncbi:ac19-like protein [Peridroma alphabaculovirus]|uniref:Ac19-like protein n=1 Tax=Peridroma alphabaculovirus TaxID=1346829 RepID=A0A068LL09_9ABAC|nr:ac19-like protein [Peridroma alphabaculovirus]AIE47838.1 ac19-like protein [Peridroma alphabaculovirus]
MNLVKLTSGGQLLNTILNIGALVDTSKSTGQRVFYALCSAFITRSTNGRLALSALTAAFDAIIHTERVLFNQRRVLERILAYLADHSDGDNLQCHINTQCLDYLMSRYV